LLLLSYDHGRVTVWDVASGKRQHMLAPPPGPVQTLQFSPNGKEVLGILRRPPDSKRHPVVVWELATGDEVRAFQMFEGWLPGMFWTPDGKHAIAEKEHADFRRKYSIVVWDSLTGQIVRTFAERTGGTPARGGFRCVRFLEDGKRLQTFDDDAVWRLWDIETGLLVRSREVMFLPADMSQDGKLIVSDRGGLHSASDGTLLRRFEAPEPQRAYVPPP
jgi:WD40 repeat protein